ARGVRVYPFHTYGIIEQLLQTEMDLAINGKCSMQQLSMFVDSDRVQVATTLHDYGVNEPKVLVYPSGDDDTGPDEVMLNVQGYLLNRRLPPILSKTDGLAGWKVKWEGGHIVVDFHNRYLMPHSKAHTSTILTIPEEMDPYHILRNRITNEVYTQDNEVKYFERTKESHNGIIVFTVGQLVEVQVSFVVVLVSKGVWKMILKLWSICILNRIIQEELNQEHLCSMMGSSSSLKKVKRRVGYEEDSDVEEAQSDLKRMRLDSVDEHRKGDFTSIAQVTCQKEGIQLPNLRENLLATRGTRITETTLIVAWLSKELLAGLIPSLKVGEKVGLGVEEATTEGDTSENTGTGKCTWEVNVVRTEGASGGGDSEATGSMLVEGKALVQAQVKNSLLILGGGGWCSVVK
ncbi:hypothetical protein POSPLADRAFT_1142711, partial [Postia placenta MAD-698-R-SB12]